MRIIFSMSMHTKDGHLKFFETYSILYNVMHPTLTINIHWNIKSAIVI